MPVPIRDLNDSMLNRYIVQESLHLGSTPYSEDALLEEQDQRDRRRQRGDYEIPVSFDLTDEEAGV